MVVCDIQLGYGEMGVLKGKCDNAGNGQGRWKTCRILTGNIEYTRRTQVLPSPCLDGVEASVANRFDTKGHTQWYGDCPQSDRATKHLSTIIAWKLEAVMPPPTLSPEPARPP